MKDHAGRLQLALSTIIAAAVALLTGPLQGLTALAVAAIVTWAIARFALQRIPGLTGDIYGAMCEIVEACVLLTCVALVSGS
jgi:adenosylcobinamide-GDP ribazoletransferase